MSALCMLHNPVYETGINETLSNHIMRMFGKNSYTVSYLLKVLHNRLNVTIHIMHMPVVKGINHNFIRKVMQYGL